MNLSIQNIHDESRNQKLKKIGRAIRPIDPSAGCLSYGSKGAALVPELLIEIFLHISSREDLDWPEEYHFFFDQQDATGGRHYEPSANLRKASQVCGHWRDVAIGVPQLWSRVVDLTNQPPEWFKEVVCRAKKVPLVVSAGRAYRQYPHSHIQYIRNTPQNLEFLLLQAKNEISEFHIDLGSEESEVALGSEWEINLLVERLRLPAPFLTQFTLNLYETRTTIREMIENPACFDLFGGHAPLLRRICFEGCLPRSQIGILQKLTHPSLIGPPLDADLLRILQCTHHLQELSLERLDWSDDISLYPRLMGISVHLPCLTRLYMQGDYILVREIIVAMKCPPLKTLVCRVEGYIYMETHEHDPFLDALKLLLPLPSNNRSNFVRNGPNTTNLSWQMDVISIRTVIDSADFILYVYDIPLAENLPYISSLMQICRILFTTCTHLVIDARRWIKLIPDSDELLFILLRPFINATSLTLTTRGFSNFLSISNSEYFYRRPILLPCLERLNFPKKSISRSFKQVSSFLSYRMNNDHPICMISLPSISAHTGKKMTEKQAIAILEEKYNVGVEFLHGDGMFG